MKRLFEDFYNHPKINVKDPKNCDTKVPTSYYKLKVVPQRPALRELS